VISGLQRDLEIEGKDKVPLLGDIPIIGWLFRNSSKTKAKTTLMIFLTPHVVRSSDDLGKIYDKKVKAQDEFLRAFYGSDFRKRDVFKRLRSLDEGKTPNKTSALPSTSGGLTPAAPAVPETPSANGADAKPAAAPESLMEKIDNSGTKQGLPSSDANPIIVPGAQGSGGGGGGDSGGSSAPPPPPAPAGE
ncbi:MAG: hypothetical protein RL189_1279, partial [Pseudomonadota bacterium]